MIKVENLTKKFGKRIVIDNLSFRVKTGEIFAFLGENGSGKTTTLRCLLGILSHDKGELLIENKIYNPSNSNILGYLPEERGIYTDNTVQELLSYIGSLKGLESKMLESNITYFLDRFELSEKRNSKVKTLSSGQQQKIQLISTLINKPKLLILDEPTKGLDPVNRQKLLDILFDLNRENKTTILFSTHQLDEAEKIAQSILIIKSGKAILSGPLLEVKKRFGENIVRINFKGNLPKSSNLYLGRIEPNYAELILKEGVDTKNLVKFLIEKNIEIVKLEVSTPSLNEIFLKVVENE